jgi:hypothetical protein
MASGKGSKAARKASKSVVITRKSTPWGTIVAVAVIVVLVAGFAVYYVAQTRSKSDLAAALAPFTPTAENQDPSKTIPGIVIQAYKGGQHVLPSQQVAYTHSPPFGGAHDQSWASCNGVVYPKPVRTENLVHSTEHGAVWIAYNADKVTGAALDDLKKKVENHPYTVMSPYPNLDAAVSLQSWGHQLKLQDPADVRVDQFITALRHNQYTYPEVGASCQEIGPGGFVEASPPPFAVAPAPGTPGSVPEDTADAAVTPDAGTTGQ